MGAKRARLSHAWPESGAGMWLGRRTAHLFLHFVRIPLLPSTPSRTPHPTLLHSNPPPSPAKPRLPSTIVLAQHQLHYPPPPKQNTINLLRLVASGRAAAAAFGGSTRWSWPLDFTDIGNNASTLQLYLPTTSLLN